MESSKLIIGGRSIGKKLQLPWGHSADIKCMQLNPFMGPPSTAMVGIETESVSKSYNYTGEKYSSQTYPFIEQKEKNAVFFFNTTTIKSSAKNR